MEKKLRYDNLDGLRVVAALLIVVKHCIYNGAYQVYPLISNFINGIGTVTVLFFMVSAFSLCCGYYDMFKNQKVSLGDFYENRYLKTLPFFTILVLIDVIYSRCNLKNIVEGFSDLTLLYGFFPNPNIEVIGVGWALGIIFAFYCLFPWFVFCIWTKKRAWYFLLVSIILNYFCEYYYLADGRAVQTNFIRWLCYFSAGGLIYLYRETIVNFVNYSKEKFVIITFVAIFFRYVINQSLFGFSILTLTSLSLYTVVFSWFISMPNGMFYNRLIKNLRNISFEIYLSHMLIYRLIEKIGLLRPFPSENISFLFICCSTIVGTCIFSYFVKSFLDRCIIAKKGL